MIMVSNGKSQEVIFSCKSKRSTHQPLVFNDNNASQNFLQKHLGVILDFKLTQKTPQ